MLHIIFLEIRVCIVQIRVALLLLSIYQRMPSSIILLAHINISEVFHQDEGIYFGNQLKK